MSLDLQPYLNARLVSVSPMRNEDFDALFAVASDRRIWEQHHDKNRYTSEGFAKFFKESMASGGAMSIFDNKERCIIGASRYKIIDLEEGIVEIGWTFLSRKYWGGKFNKEIKKLMINHALKYFKQVVFYVNEKNYRSQKALEKLGAVKITDYGLSWVLDPTTGLTYQINNDIT